MPANELTDQGSHAPDTGRQAENSGSVPMHAHVHDHQRHHTIRPPWHTPTSDFDDSDDFDDFDAFDPYADHSSCEPALTARARDRTPPSFEPP